MTPSRVFIFLSFLACASVQAQLQTTERRDFRDSSGKVNAAELLVTDGTTAAEVQIVFFSPHDVRFQVIPNLEGNIEDVRSAVDGSFGIAGINGGFFETDLSPLGLLINNGHLIHPIRKANLLSGIFLVKEGRPRIVRTRELSGLKGIEQAIQCGPFLVEDGRPVPGLNTERVAPRTFVFFCGPSCWGFGICRSVTLAAMGEMLAKAKWIPDNRIIQALNLDGGSSTTLYAKLDKNEIYSEGGSIVSNYLIINTRLPSK